LGSGIEWKANCQIVGAVTNFVEIDNWLKKTKSFLKVQGNVENGKMFACSLIRQST